MKYETMKFDIVVDGKTYYENYDLTFLMVANSKEGGGGMGNGEMRE